jgi:hypothetical protein
MHMACKNPGLLRRCVEQQLDLIALVLRDEPEGEHKTKALFYLSGAIEELDQYWDGLGVIPCSLHTVL